MLTNRHGSNSLYQIGSELKASSYCQLCQQPLVFACTSCEYITEEKVHPDCRNAEVLATTTQEAISDKEQTQQY